MGLELGLGLRGDCSGQEPLGPWCWAYGAGPRVLELGPWCWGWGWGGDCGRQEPFVPVVLSLGCWGWC